MMPHAIPPVSSFVLEVESVYVCVRVIPLLHYNFYSQNAMPQFCQLQD